MSSRASRPTDRQLLRTTTTVADSSIDSAGRQAQATYTENAEIHAIDGASHIHAPRFGQSCKDSGMAKSDHGKPLRAKAFRVAARSRCGVR